MNQFAHILAEITNTPLMITPSKADAVLSVLHRKMGTDYVLVDSRQGETPPSLAADANTPTTREPGQAGTNISVVSVLGSLVHRGGGGGFGSSGLRSYLSIRNDLDDAISDSSIGGIILDIGSHGGQSEGCLALSRYIREASQVKPIIGLARESAYSAGYAILSGCSESYVTPEGGCGSVGVILVHANQEKFNKKIGVQYTVIYSGSRKNDFSPHSQLSKEAIDRLQDLVHDGRQSFAALIAENRNMKLEDVLATEAGTYSGQAAVDIGFADAVMTWEETVYRMQELVAKHNNKSAITAGASTLSTEDKSMNLQERFETLITSNADEAPAVLAMLGYVLAAEAESTAKQAGFTAGVDQGLAQAVDIMQACRLGGITDLQQAENMITGGLDGKSAASTVLSLNAIKSDQQTALSTITPLSGDGKHGLIVACEKLAQA